MGLHLENEVYCVWQVVNTPTIILSNPVFAATLHIGSRLLHPQLRAHHALVTGTLTYRIPWGSVKRGEFHD